MARRAQGPEGSRFNSNPLKSNTERALYMRGRPWVSSWRKKRLCVRVGAGPCSPRGTSLPACARQRSAFPRGTDAAGSVASHAVPPPGGRGFVHDEVASRSPWWGVEGAPPQWVPPLPCAQGVLLSLPNPGVSCRSRHPLLCITVRPGLGGRPMTRPAELGFWEEGTPVGPSHFLPRPQVRQAAGRQELCPMTLDRA